MSFTINANPTPKTFDSCIIALNGSFLQSVAWGRWQEQNGRKVWRYVVTDSDRDNDNAQTVLAAQVIQHALPAGKHYLYVPYGPVYDESRIKNQELSKALECLLTAIHTDFPDAVFIRLEPTYNLQLTTYNLRPTLHIQPGSTILLDMRKSTEELLAGMHPKTRYNMKVAERHGVQIRPLTTPDAQAEAAALFADTLTRRKLVSPPAAYYAQLLDSPDLAVSGLGAYYNEELVACGLFIDFGHTRTYLFGGSSREHKNVMAPYLLHWTAIQDAKQRGCTTYDFFGAEGSVSDGSGFARFKQGFGGTTIPYAGAWDVVLKPLHYRAYQLLRTLNRWFKHI